ncbi:MAG: peptidylprolyl isomerase [Flavobacteriales bacterium]|nr:peptidylprolyl isomerase [Flavobacteriales bacterium]
MPGNARTSKCYRVAGLVLAVLGLNDSWAQPQGHLIDRIIADVGQEIILYSELMGRVEQAAQGTPGDKQDLICPELEELLLEKLMLEQARIDSVQVDEGQIQGELDRRIRFFISQIGSEQKLEEFYGKSIAEIRSEFHDQVRDQLMVQRMQSDITSGIRVTPRDVERFFKKMPQDSLPFINAQVSFSQIVRMAQPSEDEERRARRKLEEWREGLVKGEKDFCTLAILYSEDPGSAKNCGELGLVPKGVMVPEFDAVALSLRPGEISSVFKTPFGYHLMQMIERRGEQYNARHILIRPQVKNEDLNAARNFVDSLAILVRDGKVDFNTAAGELSDDEESKGTGGVVIEPRSNSTRWAIGDLDQQDFFVIDKLRVGEISVPVPLTMPDGSKGYRIIRVDMRTEPHRANLKDDYLLIQQVAENELREKALNDWIAEQLKETHVRVIEGYQVCTFQNPWLKRATP